MVSPLGYTLVFHIVYAIYWLITKIHIFVDRLIRSLSQASNSVAKINQKIQSLHKLPVQVIVAVQVNEPITDCKISKNILDYILYNVQIIRNANISQIKLFLWGNSQKDIQMLQNLLQEEEYKQNLNNIDILNFDKFHQNLTNQSIQWNKKSVPLLITMSSYNSLNCLPFNYLIDAQFVFCPPISECSPIDIQRCFEQYANSKQRHGK